MGDGRIAAELNMFSHESFRLLFRTLGRKISHVCCGRPAETEAVFVGRCIGRDFEKTFRTGAGSETAKFDYLFFERHVDVGLCYVLAQGSVAVGVSGAGGRRGDSHAVQDPARAERLADARDSGRQRDRAPE